MDNNDSSKQVSESELLWVESESIRQVRELAEGSSKSAVVMVVSLLAMMYPHVDTHIWLIWAVLHAFVLAMRILHIAYLKSRAEEKYDFHQSIFVVCFIGFSWGSTAYPLLSGDTSKIEIIILNLILVYGIASVVNLARHAQILNIFFKSYGSGLLGAALLNIVFYANSETIGDNVTVFVLLSLFLFALNKVGVEINKSHIQTLHLQYNNKLLIESLTIEKQTAINAVDVKNRFMASATHDMRQPILALDLYTDMVVNAPETLPKLVPKIAEATKSVITMFDAMFDLARMSMNQLLPEKVHFNLKDMIEALAQQYQPVAKEKGLQFRVQYKNTDKKIIDDPILLRRIISNLISNAIKYTETGGILLVCRNCEKYGFRIEVWDTGVGISPAMQKAVFTEFYKNPENTGTSDGFGLGLAIVAQLCVLLGHKLTMKSRRGHGTVMSVGLSNSLVPPDLIGVV
jgi:signal transduction histidine kinase